MTRPVQPRPHRSRKLSDAQVIEARALFTVRERKHGHHVPLLMKDLAARFGVHKSTLHRAAARWTYKRVEA